MNATCIKLIIVVLMSLANCVLAGDNRWTSNGPLGGAAGEFTFHPQNNSLIFMGGFRSLNAGITWQRMDVGVRIRIHPKSPGTAVTTDGDFFFTSTDKGTTWKSVGNKRLASLVTDFEFHSTNFNVLYAATSIDGVFKSTDSGRTWAKKSNGLGFCCNGALEVDPFDGNTVYVLASNGAFKTTNGGDSWKPARNGLLTNPVFYYQLAIDSQDPDTLYAGGPDGVFKTTNGGAQWFSTNCACDAHNITIDPKAPATIYIGGSRLLKSTNAGGSWKPVELPVANTGQARVGIHPRVNNLFFVTGLGSGLLRSKDGGRTFKLTTKRFNNLTIEDVESTQPGKIFATADSCEGVYFSGNHGKSWKPITGSVTSENAFCGDDFQIHPSDPSFIVVIGRDLVSNKIRIRVSSNGGGSFHDVELPFDSEFSTSVLLDPASSSNLYLRTINVGVFKSTDSGNTWTSIGQGLTAKKDVNSITIDTRNPATLFAGTRLPSKIFKSVNAGESWKDSSNGLPLSAGFVQNIAVSPHNSNVVFAATSDGIFRSTDGGEKWTRKKGGILSDFVVPDPADSRVIFADGANRKGNYVNQLFVSADGGDSWDAFDTNGLQSFSLLDLVINPQQPNTLLLATEQGVFSYNRTIEAGAPAIDQLSPPAARSGDSIEILGRNFGSIQGDSKVFFGTLDSGPSQNWSDNKLKVRVPSGAKTGPVTVTVASRKSNSFQFVATAGSGNVEPASGSRSGGTRVSIVAPKGFAGTKNFNVLFGATLAKDLGFVFPDIITCTAPSGTGKVDVSVVTNAVTYTAGSFNYE